ncbi:Peptidyl-prolyl cis-trans isomerase FKBP16-3, chloroplastic [Porphyridium purpureum]|uniref:peptidylprolyl isomerase n=1 Tax=Porphyridium purpureum TaxID=35688 RepID=A0A5J4YUA3_PORPP|nr:Peptidyl-prolyl cis-trans isomerase FKBP16-3, chloroplastic [Porphyridium purpureum]|eukprot:POR6313..scf227_4
MAFVSAVGACARRAERRRAVVCAARADDSREAPSRRQVLRDVGVTVLGVAFGTSLGALRAPDGSVFADGRGGLVPAVIAAEEKKAASKLTFIDTESGLAYAEIKKGSGPMPHDGDLVIVNYVAYLADGTIFDNTTVPGRKPLAFQMGARKVIPGLEEALRTMQPGGKRKVIVPPKLAYGSRGVCFGEEGCLVPPNSVLEYDLELVRVAVSPT